MKLKVLRTLGTQGCTLGTMSVDGKFQCYTLEDEVREEKIYGETAIPAGEYRVIVNHSPHFNRELPLLLNVPGYEGVRIHPGNTAADTLGCILVGASKGATSITQSVVAFTALFDVIQNAIAQGEDVWISLG